MFLPKPPHDYQQAVEIKRNLTITEADGRNRKMGADVELDTERLIIRSPDGHRWAITVSNAGVVGATLL